MLTEVEKLIKRLEEKGARVAGITLGDKSCAAEEIAAEMNRALDEVEAGRSKLCYDLDNGLDFDSQKQADEFYRLYPEPYWRPLSTDPNSSKETYLDRMEEYEKNLQQRYKDFKNNILTFD